MERKYGIDAETLNHIESFCKSKYLNLEDYFNDLEEQNMRVSMYIQVFAKQLMNLMATGQMRITHSFYLKIFHKFVMAEKIKLPAVDKLLIDECQDSSSITLDIASKIPNKQLILVGDDNQRLYTFLKLEDGFKRFPADKILTLSKSFRVSNEYAPAIQQFLRLYLDEPDTIFEGMDYLEDRNIVTKAYLTRTNAALIGKMIELNKANIPYQLSNKMKIGQMFKFPLALIYGKPGFNQRDDELKHIQEAIDEWGNFSKVKKRNISKLSHIMRTFPNDERIKQASRLILKFSPQNIIDAYKSAEEYKKSFNCNLKLMTSFTSKGSTFDAVELDYDLDESIQDIIVKKRESYTEEERALMANYFVACTRHRYKLKNAKCLEKIQKQLA